ncbi:MAG: HAD hydrolase family protein [Halanaerobiales bacterium]
MQLLIFRIEDIVRNQVSKLSLRDTIALKSWKILGHKTTFITNKGIIEQNLSKHAINSFNKIILYNGGVIYDTEKKIPLIINFFNEYKIGTLLSYIDKYHTDVLPIVDKLNTLLISKKKSNLYPPFYQTNSKKIRYFSRISYSNIAKIKLFGPQEKLREIKKEYSSIFRFYQKSSMLEVFPHGNINYKNIIQLSKFDRIIEIATKQEFFDDRDILVSTYFSPERLKSKAEIIISKEYENEILYGAICNLSEALHCKNLKVVGK